MSTYTSPVARADFQTYLKDVSTDATLLAFFQTCLDTATEYVYTWLDKDYTASAAKTDVFWGNDSIYHVPRNPCGTLTGWVYLDASGTTTTVGVTDLMLRENGTLIMCKTLSFISGAACWLGEPFSSNSPAVEHRISYTQPSSLTCPETVKQVITEIAALLFMQSNEGIGTLGYLAISNREAAGSDRDRYLDLSERHKEMLRPYKRYPV